jgi:type IV pilus assembly protein PilN
MRVDINLASQPYEDARQFWLRWGSALMGVAILTLVLLMLTISGWFAARRDRTTIAHLEKSIADRDAIRTKAEEFLNQPENRTTRDESRFLNGLIDRKSFSWTKVLEDLEKVMPPRVHLVSIHPELDEDNQLALKMQVAGSSRDRGIELAQRMEESHRFAQTHIVNEQSTQSATGDTESFDIEALYIPEAIAQPALAVKTAPAATTKAETPKRSKP